MSLEFGLQLYSVRDELTKDFTGTLEKVAAIGFENVELFFHDADHIGGTVGGLNPTELQKFDNQYVMDIILENTDEQFVKVEFDTYWAMRGGVEPLEYLQQLGDRCDLLHQKDLPAHVKPVNLFEVIGEDAHIDMELMVKLHRIDYFTEAGQGIMDIPAIVQAFSSKPEARYLFIEQDWTRKNQLESVEISYKYISNLFQSLGL
ncbi:sugar phosphate isomerase/epimerase family protein [Paenibacillus apiarius]|uniref:Xylose isomerase-like TIM barrel domain-containing protein n=1 Tax=Paenibacillus apiarius TaxID=46240 RepID=A0ABT4DXP6_9BACL|nr:hypothetical protein [Paenibacillus apiarius]MCY9513092.1 hypothetical protein [Paenibacillus apiarius]MCY9521550.1 hypothetical protein [Paenibacillus apiarius]MCY9551704.1 hypothetical protein [Paenibacillus apiarius]MCY9560508.1 hypothetical protein [Paenibacillus apiarius]MCY9685242.1 hypothetical protein [Paenibacillus apiarius]